MATIQKTPYGTYRAHLCVKGTRDSGTFDSRAQAKAWAAKRETELRARSAGAIDEKLTVADLFRRYAAEISPRKRGVRFEQFRLQAFERMKIEVDGARIEFGKLPLVVVKTRHIAAFRDMRAKTVSGATIRREMNILSHCFAQARKEWNWIEQSPTRDVARPPVAPHRKRRITGDEIRRICFALGYDDGMTVVQTKSQAIAVAFLFAIETAMRAGEICGIQRGQHKERQGISFLKARNVVHLGLTKNGDSRDVPISPRAIDLLSRLPLTGPALFGLNTASIDALFRRACNRAGVDDLRFHDSRHEAISRLVKVYPVIELARIVGHRNLNELLTYYHPDIEELAAKLEALPRQA